MGRVAVDGGISIAVSERSGSLPGTVVLVHATGFCKETWEPVVAALPETTIIALDQRGHGGSDVGSPPFDWWDLGRDVLAVTRRRRRRAPVVGVGHSSGGAALVMAEIAEPGTFDGLVLVEPVIFPGPYGRFDDHPLAIGALRRRRRFGSVGDVIDTFRARGPFAGWTDQALEAYARHGTIDSGDGTRRLACAPEVEAEFYRAATAHGAWDRLAEVACPVVVVIGEQSDSHPEEFARDLTGRFPVADLHIVPEATHFVPMERPREVAQVVRSVLGV
jgi:pimeloyl-ACP methyl ester carboxylesterase